MRSLYAALVARFMHGWRRAFCFVLCCSSLNFAHAGMTTDVGLPRVVRSGWDVVYQSTSGAVPASGGIGPRTYTPAGDVWGDVLQTEKGWLTRSGPFERTAPSIEVTVRRRVVASSVARIAAKTLPIIGTASLAYDIWTELGCQFVNGSVACEELLDQEQGIVERWVTNYPALEAPSPWALCTKYAAVYNMLPKEILPADNESQRVCRYGTQAQINAGDFYGGTLMTRLDGQGDQGCPDGEKAIGDKCTGGPPQPCDEECLVDRWGKGAPGIPGAAGKGPDIVAEGDRHGKGAPAGQPSITGPASQQGPATNQTTSGPNGTTTTSTVPTYNYTYGPTNVTYTTTNVTTQTITNNAGDTITNTTTETDAPPKDERTECEKNPDTVGCTPLGEVPDEEVTKLTRDVSVSAEAVNLPAQCPAPIDAAGYSLSFDAACDFSEGVHPFVLAAAALMAGLIVIRSIQGA